MFVTLKHLEGMEETLVHDIEQILPKFFERCSLKE